MSSKILLGAQIVAGLILLVFGVMKFFPLAEPKSMGIAMDAYKMALLDTGFMMQFIGIVEVVSGISFLVGRYVALSAIPALTIAINAFLAHLFLGPSSILPAIVLLGLTIATMYRHKNAYGSLLRSER